MYLHNFIEKCSRILDYLDIVVQMAKLFFKGILCFNLDSSKTLKIFDCLRTKQVFDSDGVMHCWGTLSFALSSGSYPKIYRYPV
jgi:hypothetical protein